MILRGKLVRLRPVRCSDLNVLLKWHNDEKLAYLNARDFRRTAMSDHLRWFGGLAERRDTRQWMICRGKGAPVGKAGFWNVDLKKRSAHLGLYVAPSSARGKGFGKETIALLADHAFRSLFLKYLDAEVVSHNRASLLFFEKCGWKRTRLRGRSVLQKGRKRTCTVFRLHAPERKNP